MDLDKRENKIRYMIGWDVENRIREDLVFIIGSQNNELDQ